MQECRVATAAHSSAGAVPHQRRTAGPGCRQARSISKPSLAQISYPQPRGFSPQSSFHLPWAKPSSRVNLESPSALSFPNQCTARLHIRQPGQQCASPPLCSHWHPTPSTWLSHLIAASRLLPVPPGTRTSAAQQYPAFHIPFPLPHAATQKAKFCSQTHRLILGI